MIKARLHHREPLQKSLLSLLLSAREEESTNRRVFVVPPLSTKKKKRKRKRKRKKKWRRHRGFKVDDSRLRFPATRDESGLDLDGGVFSVFLFTRREEIEKGDAGMLDI